MESFKPPLEEEQNKSNEQVKNSSLENQKDPEKGMLVSLVDKAKESWETHKKWEEVKNLAKENNLEFRFKDEKDERGGSLTGSSEDVSVRKSKVTPEEATEFIINLVKTRKEMREQDKK